MSDIVDFLRLLWPSPPDGFLTLWRKSDRRSKHLPLRASSLENDFAAIATAAFEWDQAGEDTYYGIALRKQELDQYHQGDAQEALALPGLFVDIDVRGPEGVHNAKGALPADGDHAHQILTQAVPLSPTAVVWTGYGLHAYWLFPEFLFLRKPGVFERAKKALRNWQLKFIEFAAKSEIHVDNTGTITRVYRLPGTHNYKIKTDPQEVLAIDLSGPRYTLEQLEEVSKRGRGRPSTGRWEEKPVQASALFQSGGSDNTDTIPDWFLKTFERLQNLPKDKDVPERKQRLDLLLAGISFADRGERDEAMQQMASVVAFVAQRTKQDVEPQDLFPFFEDSLRCWASEPDATKTLEEELEKLEEKLGRALNEAEIKFRSQHEAESKVAKALMRVADRKGIVRQRPRPTEPGVEPTAGANGANGVHHEVVIEGELVEEEDEDGGEEKEAEEKEPELSARQKEKLLRQLVIQHRNAFYILRDGKYQPPVTKEELEVALRDDFADSEHASFYYEDKDGNLKRKKISDFLQDYCTVARQLYFDLRIDESWYDAETQTFFEAAAPLRDLEPEFNPQIDEWLRIFGGNDHERLLDWIATVTWLDRQTCALYCSGWPGSGKSMLAAGLARLWWTGAPTEIIQVLGNFNADILRCPLLVADEHLPGKRVSAELRLLIGTSTRTLTRKHLPNAPLLGALRVMLLANNERMLAFGSEELDQLDLEAVAGRFLHIDTPVEAARYLESIGGRDGTDGWVDDDKIAKHALWLSQNRYVKPGKRWLVAGHQTRMHRSLVMQAFTTSNVLEWLAKYLENPIPNPIQKRTVIMGDGDFYIMSSAISDHWEQFVRSHQVPNLTRIGTALSSISNATFKSDGREYWKVNTGIVMEWAEKHKAGSLEDMQKNLLGPRKQRLKSV